MRSAVLFCLVLAASGASVSLGRAQSLASEGCAPELPRRVEAALAVELIDAEPEITALAPEATLSIVCGDLTLVLRAETPNGRYAEQGMPLELGAERRAAITLLELVRTLFDVSARPPPPARSLLIASGGVLVLGDPVLVTGGGGLSLRVVIDPWVQLGVSVEALAGTLQVAPGQLGLVLGAASLSVRFGGRVGDVQLHAGPQVSGALLSWTGMARSPDVEARPALGPRVAVGAVAAVSYLLLEMLALDLELSVDGAFLGSEARADATAVAHTLGPSFAARVGLGWVLP